MLKLIKKIKIKKKNIYIYLLIVSNEAHLSPSQQASWKPVAVGQQAPASAAHPECAEHLLRETTTTTH